MPYTDKQNRLFEAAAHSPAVASRVGIPVATAAKMASEGVKSGGAIASRGARKGQMLAALLRKK